MTDVNNLFLLGAGFDRAIFPDIAMNGDLLSEIRKPKHKKSTQLETHLAKYQGSQIERYLTKLDLEIADSAGDEKCCLERAREEINKRLVSYFSQFRFRESIFNSDEKKWLGEFAKTILKENDAIVTLNYSCFLDGLLDWCEVWSPNGGYTNHIMYHPGLEKRNDDGHFKNITIYKIHGSEHFIELYDKDPKHTWIGIDMSESDKIFLRSGSNNFIYAKGINRKEGHIIAPSFVKISHPQLLYLTAEALRKASVAKKLIIIGCGLRPEDNNVWLLLANYLMPTCEDPVCKNRKLIIFDKVEDKDEKAKKTEQIKNTIKARLGIQRDDFCEVNLDGIGEEKSIEKLKKFLSS